MLFDRRTCCTLILSVFLITYLTQPTYLHAQKRYSIASVSSNEGLPTDEIKKVFQDAGGFVWLATPEGLIRYDGYDYKIFSTSNYITKGLITNNFIDIAQDSNGDLWCATDHGVARLDLATERFTFFNSIAMDWNTQSYDLINSIAIDKGDHIWIGTAGNGAIRLSPNDNQIIRFNKQTPNLGMSSEWVTRIICDSKDNVWIGTWEGNLTLINLERNIYKSWSALNRQLLFSTNSVYSMHEFSDNKYWIGLWGQGVVEFQLTSNYDINLLKHYDEQLNCGSAAVENIVYDIDIDKDNNLWLGTPKGIIHIIDPETASPAFKRINAEMTTNTQQYEAFSVLCDNSGLIWGGTMVGVNILDPYMKIFTPYNIPILSDAIASQAVTAFTIDPWGRLLVGVRSYGFGLYDLKDQTFVSFSEVKPYSKLNIKLNTINCFFWDNSGYLWLGTRYLGLIKLDPKTGDIIEINKNNRKFNFDADQVHDIIQDHTGNIWVGSDKGLYKIIPYKPVGFDNFSVIKYSHEPKNSLSISSNHISKILEDSNHQIWVSTPDKGINKLISDISTHIPVTFQRFSVQDKGSNNITSDQILTMFEDSRKTIWIGTGGGGLMKWNAVSLQFNSIKEIDEMLGDAIFNITEDQSGDLWIASNQGLSKLHFDKGKPICSTFKQINGLQSNNFIKGAVFKDKSGNLYFGGNKGFNHFNPQTIQSNPFIPTPAISEIRVMNENRQIPPTNEPLVLYHNEKSFSITLSALSYSQPLNNKYATRLDGLEDNWRITDAMMRTVTYANLKPGTYTLYFTASNSNGLWSQTPRTLQIIVKPAPYATWWAITIYFLILSFALIYVIYKERKSNQIKHYLEIEHIEHEKAEKMVLFKKQLFANISNEFITPLNILSVFIENWRQKKTTPSLHDYNLAQRNINRLIRFNNQFLYYSTAEFNQISLNIEQLDIDAFINEVCDGFHLLMDKKEIEFTKDVKLSNKLVWFDPEKLDIILYNLLSHIIKLIASRGSITLKLHLKADNGCDYACFQIAYNQILNNRDQEMNLWDTTQENNDYTGNFGIGLAITKQMIELHQGEFDIQTNTPQGVVLSFKIPVSKTVYSKAINTSAAKGKMQSIDFLKNQVPVEEEVITNLKNLTSNTSEKRNILIIEQDADFRKVLKVQLSPYFNIKEANNGQSGFTYVTNHALDLIIANVDSPVLSGIELCKSIRATPTKANTPIILLSGQVSETERALCYKAGVDSYITKPININTLLIRVQALIEQRSKLVDTPALSKHKTSANQFLEHTKNDKFLNEVMAIVNKNLSNPHFNVKQLATELNVSNSMLYRKLSDLVNLNPNAFIKKIRLIKATELLEETDLSISEIAFECGFSDISYFGYAFKKDFGISPSSYQRK